MSSDESTSVKVPVFNGDKKKFQSWWIKFEVYARVKGFQIVLKDSGLTISEDDMDALELKEKYETGGSNDRSANKEKQLKLGK